MFGKLIYSHWLVSESFKWFSVLSRIFFAKQKNRSVAAGLGFPFGKRPIAEGYLASVYTSSAAVSQSLTGFFIEHSAGSFNLVVK